VHARALEFSSEDKEEPVKVFKQTCDMIRLRKMILTTVRRIDFRGIKPGAMVAFWESVQQPM
jgi:hypothetical protein